MNSDELQGLEKGQFFLKAVDIAAEQIFASPDFQKHIEQFGKDREEIAKQAIKNHRFDQVDLENGEYNSLLKLGAQKQQVWRHLALENLDSGENLGFSGHEALILKEGLLLAPIIDQMYFKWREQMIHSDLGKKLREMGAEAAAKYLEEQKATNPYTMPVLENDKVIEKPYSIYFKEDTAQIIQIFDELIGKLKSMPPNGEIKAFTVYFEALKDAFAEEEASKLEEKWFNVDKVWMDVKSDFQPIHPMESYVDPARIRVDLEFRIVIPDDGAKNLNAATKVTQGRLIEDLQKLYPNSQTLKQSIAPMESCKVLAGTTIVMCGWDLDFRSAGQNVPNREEVKLLKGVKIFLDTKSLELRGNLMKKMAETIFDKEIIDKNYQDDDFLISAGIIVAGHEVSHNAFVTPDSDPKIGKTLRSLVEETKATMSSLVILPYQETKHEISPDMLRQVVTVLLGESLRELVMQGKEAVKPYYITGVAHFNMLISAGVVAKNGDKWVVDLADEKINQFFLNLKKGYDLLVDSYETYSSAKVEEFFKTYFVENEQIMELVKLAKNAEVN
jgi:hypothetical protein